MTNSIAGVRPMVCVLMERAVSHADLVMPWLMQIAQQGWAIAFEPYQRTDVARNKFGKALLGTDDLTHLVMLDLDHAHPPDVVWQLCRRVAEDPAREVLSLMACRRREPFDPIAFNEAPDKPGFYEVAPGWDSGEVIEVERLGFGAAIIARSVLERLDYPWFRYEYPGGDAFPTEDIWFSKRCREAGIRLWVDAGHETDHLITSRVNLDVFRAYLARRAELAGG